MMLSEGLILSGYPNHSRKIARLDALDATATDTPKLKSSDVAMLSNFLRTALESVLRAGPAVNDLQLQCLRSTLTHFKRQLSCKDDVYWGLVAVSEQVVLTASDPSWQDYENLRAFFFEAGLGAAASARCASIAARSVCSPRDLAQKAQAQKTDTKAVGVGVGGVGVVGVGLMDFQLSDAQSQLLCAALTALDPPQFLQSLSQDPLSNSAVSPLSVSMWSDVPSSTPAPTPALTPAPTLEPSDSPPAPPAPSSSTHPPTAHTPTPHAHSHPHTHTHWVDDFSNSILHSVAKELAEEVAHQSMLQSQSQSQELQPPSGAEALSVSVVVPVTAQERYQYEVETGLFAEDTFGMGVGMGVGVGVGDRYQQEVETGQFDDSWSSFEMPSRHSPCAHSSTASCPSTWSSGVFATDSILSPGEVDLLRYKTSEWTECGVGGEWTGVGPPSSPSSLSASSVVGDEEGGFTFVDSADGDLPDLPLRSIMGDKVCD